MERISRDDLNLEIASLISKRGTCKRAQVGALITLEGRIISSGYNGSILEGHCEDLGCDLNSKCTHAVHAEANAICHAAKHDIGLKGCTLYCTTAPCIDCAKLIVQSGIIRVVYMFKYRNDDGIQLLRQCNVKVDRSEQHIFKNPGV